MSGIDGFLVAFGAAAIAFGLWLAPKWRRARRDRQARDEGVLFSPARAREWWLWLNVVTSIGAGLAMIAVVGVGQLQRARERARQAAALALEAELRRYVPSCTRETVVLANPGPAPRRLRVGKPVIRQRSWSLVEPRETWNGSWVDTPDLVLAPGQTTSLRYVTTPGVWGADITFDLDLGDRRGTLSCPLR